MPAEVARLSRRLGSRDRWFIVLAALATVVAVIAIALGSRGSAEARSATRCVGLVSPGFMGATRAEYCDAKATAICRSQADVEDDLPAQCARLDPALRP